MEIRVTVRLTGRELRERILQKYGTREALVKKAGGRRAFEAKSDLLDLGLLEEDSRRLDEPVAVEDVVALTPGDLERLTSARLRLLSAFETKRSGWNVTALAAFLGRDKKNVSEDVKTLARLGLVRETRVGREKLVEPWGTDIHIVLDVGDALPPASRPHA